MQFVMSPTMLADNVYQSPPGGDVTG